MNQFKRSLCSTCVHRSYCVLSSDRSNINLCNEYRQHMDDENEPTIVFSDEMY
jgi:hypothetical protein